ncbi:hypothetical protein [Salipiger bermudensis]|uniref:Nodulation protein (Outer membrane efflux protein) n=1 Tax=Salipiger bermudensis (strain DSM 26914 / JCM 13377 / KCTC 12554 / HTCC2601) TaxID=314265 RepID=Q0FSZ0_SALBH|nr:hypothetical protein [Salipiger bermudensis]EAU47379.1 nodulation protein (outer membrane efflux protein) [Salipiger bermudensis HTCC2601]
MTPKKTALLSLTLGLAACTVGPEYQAPSETLAVAFAEGSAQPIGQAAQQYWWRAFNDNMLNELVQTGLDQTSTSRPRSRRWRKHRPWPGRRAFRAW